MNQFFLKYQITEDFIPVKTKRRSGQLINKVVFIVAHDTGNPTSTAKQNVHYFKDSCNDMSASAHIFVDDKDIIECVPALEQFPEKAWHVYYSVKSDNNLYGCDANDAAIGVEYCYGNNINSDEAYKRYVWVLAYIAFRFQLKLPDCITGHFILDPDRKTDPQSGLKASGRSYEQLLIDVVNEYKECLKVTED
jgi:N-acetylmuramoyl-L-alanine amidase CwlA